MKKIRFISLFLVLILCFSAFGCGDSNQESGEIVIPTAGVKIVENGNSDYKIVLASNARDYVKTAASEIQYFIKNSTGYQLSIVDDSNITVNKDSKYISVGKNKITEYYKLNVTESEVGTRGFKIKTQDKTVMISGATELGFGTLYGAYKFLEHTINYNCFDPYFGIRYDEKSSVDLLSFDITDKPDIEYNMLPSGLTEFDLTSSHRIKMEGFGDFLMTDYGTVHNDFEYLPPSVYLKDHPKWYDSETNPQQLCYTAHGIPSEYELMVDTISEKMIGMLDKYPDYVNLALTEMDVQTWCTCGACKASNTKYGGNSAVCVKLCNDIAKKIENHYKDQGKEREFYIFFFVYMKTEDAPVKEVDGKYVAVDNSVYCNEHVIPWIGTMYTQCRVADFDSDRNKTAKGLIEQWSLLSDKIAIWTYYVSFENFLIPYNSMTCIPNNLKFFKDSGTVLYMNNGGYIANATAFDSVRRYLTAQFAWDAEADYNKVIEKYFNGVYGVAGKIMSEFYTDWIARCQYNYDSNLISGKDDAMPSSEMYPYSLLKKWIDMLDNATALIKGEYSSEKSADFLKAVNTEKVSLYYLMINLHPEKYSDANLLALKKEFKQICQDVGIYDINSKVPLTTLYAEWGI